MQIDLHVTQPLSLSVFNEAWFSEQVFEKMFKYQITRKKSVGVVPSGQTDRHDEADSPSSPFRERA